MNIRTIALLGITFVMASCGNGSDDNSNLGAQIDAMGRAAINTALIDTFASDADRSAAEDEFNETNNVGGTGYRETMARQLAVYDALVGSCGDNPLTNRASANPADGLATGADRYDFIASVFADDQLYVNGSSPGADAGKCAQYLSAELGVIGVTGLEDDCGGRAPLYDVIAITYSAVSIGATAGVDDGISRDNVAQSNSRFPFLAPAR